MCFIQNIFLMIDNLGTTGGLRKVMDYGIFAHMITLMNIN